MTRSNSDRTAVSTRRHFLSQAAGVAAGSTALALATIPPAPAADAPASALDPDSELLHLETQIFEQREAADAYNDEIARLGEIWGDEIARLDAEYYAGRSALTNMERWDIIKAMPESVEHERVAKLQRPHAARQDALMEKMFATPARTSEGRRAKVTVLLSCLLGEDWCLVEGDMDYPVKIARKLLIEFVGGQPGEQLRDQFVSGPLG
jgi:hypothetical protein